MLSILRNVKSLFSGSRGLHGPDLPSPYGRKFHIHCFTPGLMIGEVSLETLPKNMLQGMINSENSMNTTELTNTNIFKINWAIQTEPLTK